MDRNAYIRSVMSTLFLVCLGAKGGGSYREVIGVSAKKKKPVKKKEEKTEEW